MLNLNNIKKYCCKKHNLPEESASGSYSYLDIALKFQTLMIEHKDKVMEIYFKVAKGENFRKYFTNKEAQQELLEMRKNNPDKFYSIIRKEELFLNTCLRTFGFYNIVFTIDPDKIEDMFNDEDNLL